MAADSSPPPPPCRVSLSPFTPIPAPINPRRLSSHFTKPTSPVRTGRSGRKNAGMAWVDLQGRIVGAEEACSARAIGSGLSRKEAIAWELFSPIHRVLIVAVVAAAAAKSEKNRQIGKLRSCVQLRDQILMSMQQKLDDLCEQVTYQPQPVSDISAPNIPEVPSNDSICTNCWLCDQHQAQLNDLPSNSLMKAAAGDEMFKSRVSISNVEEQEERRMSDLSDWASSVTSATDLQLNNLAIEQDIYNLKRECEEKDAAVKELSTFIRSKDVATSKRIGELEDIIRRKNTTITRLKKDMIVLEQKLMNLTRARRRSYSGPATEKKHLPTMTDNIVYDMDSPTSPLSSDSEVSPEKQNTCTVGSEVVATPLAKPVQSELTSESEPKQNTCTGKSEEVVETPLDKAVQSELTNEIEPKKNQKSAPAKISSSSPKLFVQIPISRPVTPLKEKSMNQRHNNSVASPKSTQVSANAGTRNNKRRPYGGSKDIATQKRWF